MSHRDFYFSVKGANLCYCPIKTLYILSWKQARVRELYLKLKGFLGGSYSPTEMATKKITLENLQKKKALSVTSMAWTMKKEDLPCEKYRK